MKTLLEVISKKMGIVQDQIHLDSKYEDLGVDSLDRIVLAFAIEDEYDVKLEDEEWDKIRTIGETVVLLQSKKVPDEILQIPVRKN